jgi:hypothetical protein
MPQFLIILIFFMIVSPGCAKKEQAALQIGDIKISKQELLDDYQSSSFYQIKDFQGFLDQYISKKLILLEAERRGTDKDPKFLADIKQYWEEGLLKLTLSDKNNEFSSMAVVTQESVESFYNQNKDSLFAGKDLTAVQQNIHDYLAREKQKEALSRWVESLRQNTKVNVNKEVLGIK